MIPMARLSILLILPLIVLGLAFPVAPAAATPGQSCNPNARTPTGCPGGVCASGCLTGETCIGATGHPPVCVSGSSSGNQTSLGGSLGSGSSGGGVLSNPLKASSISELLTVVLQAVVRLGAIFLVLALVYVGFLFVQAQGKEEKIRDARQALMWTVIGGLILLGAESIALVIESTVNAL